MLSHDCPARISFGQLLWRKSSLRYVQKLLFGVSIFCLVDTTFVWCRASTKPASGLRIRPMMGIVPKYVQSNAQGRVGLWLCRFFWPSRCAEPQAGWEAAGTSELRSSVHVRVGSF